MLTLKHLEEASWPSGIDGPATIQRLKAFCAKHSFEGPCAGLGDYREVNWDLDNDKLTEGPLPHQKVAAEPTRKSVEACLIGEACSPFTACPTKASRDCLRASVPFRTPLRRISCCFRCCTKYWLDGTRLGRNLDAAGAGMLAVSDSASQRYSKPNPDSGDFGLAPRTNVLAHPHMSAAARKSGTYAVEQTQITRFHAGSRPLRTCTSIP